MSIYFNFYALQNMPPNNVNRDDTGSPKMAPYGGVLRSRVSSQAQKHAMRLYFKEHFKDSNLGVRTKKAVSLIADKIVGKRPDLADTANKYAEMVLGATGVKMGKSTRKGNDEGSVATAYLVFIADSELDGLANLAIEWADKGADSANAAMKKEVRQVFHGAQAVDIALFGRMLAGAPDLNTDASSQVAHALSVDAVSQDFDYFTAVDDKASDDNAGAGMIGTVPFTSSTLYRYADVNATALVKQLGSVEAAARAVSGFAEAFFKSMPTGKQNTFANRTLPEVCFVTVREDQPVNLVDAFETPVRATQKESVTENAARRLGAREQQLDSAYDVKPVAAYNVTVGDPVPELDAVSDHVNFTALCDDLASKASQLLGQDQAVSGSED